MIECVRVSTSDTELLEAKCSLDGNSFKVDDSIVQCPICKMPYHLECWRYNNNRCATHACPGSGQASDPPPLPPINVTIIETATPVTPPETIEQAAETVTLVASQETTETATPAQEAVETVTLETSQETIETVTSQTSQETTVAESESDLSIRIIDEYQIPVPLIQYSQMQPTQVIRIDESDLITIENENEPIVESTQNRIDVKRALIIGTISLIFLFFAYLAMSGGL